MPNAPRTSPAQAKTSKTRSKSMRLLQEAALELLIDHDPNGLTIREIAESAGVHHRYIPDYFGGKAELLASIYPIAIDEAVNVFKWPMTHKIVGPTVIRVARLAIWLSTNHPAGVPHTERKLFHRLQAIMSDSYHLDSATAALVAERLIASVIMIAAFPDVISPGPVDLEAHMALEVKIVSLLAQQ